ncbi:MAG: sigma-70 family RNA polymerase sigma factor [Bacteroidia bacterium]
MQPKASDIELIQSVLKGNRMAYADLIKRHQRYVFTLALRFVKSREEAEEVAQDVFVKAFNALKDFQGTAKFSTWLYRITFNTAMVYNRKKKLDLVSVDDEAYGYSAASEIATDSDESFDHKSKSVYLSKAINSLAEDDATVITLFYQNEQSLEEIAEIMNIEPNNAKVKLHRARLRLKQKLEVMLKEEVKDLI